MIAQELTDLKYQVLSLDYLTKTHLRLIIAPMEQSFNYQAGQYLKLLYPSSEYMPFSIANAPLPNGQIELHIRLAPMDNDTLEMVTQINSTKEVRLTGPFGHCYYRDDQRPLIIIAAGTGFAPAKALIESMIGANHLEKECHLYWCVKEVKDLYLEHLPITWSKTLTNFNYVPIVSKVESSNSKTSLFDTLLNKFDSFSNYNVYVFGPLTLAVEALKELTTKDLKKSNFFSDVLNCQ